MAIDTWQLIGPSKQLEPLGLRGDIALPRPGFSFSQMRLWLTCGACYEARYVLNKPGMISPALVTGSATHAALAAARNAVQRGETLPLPDILDAASDAFDGAMNGLDRDGNEPARPPVEKLGAKFESWAKTKDSTIALVKVTVPQILEAEAPFKILATEAQIDFRGVFPFPFTAYADVMLDDPTWRTFGVIKDTKTSGQDKAPDEWAAWQLSLYALPFHKAGEAVDLGVDQIVNTRNPTVHLWTEPAYQVRPSAGQMDYLERLVVHVAEQISAGRFEPRPQLWGCDFEHGLPKFGIVAPEVAA